jgi:hypothetical protein
VTDHAVIEVPTVRTDNRMQWVLLVVLVLNLLVTAARMSLPVALGAGALAVAGVITAVVLHFRTSKGRPPVRVTPGYLQLPDSETSTVEIDWADIAGFRIRRRQLLPHLEVEPVDPARLRPAPDPWQRAAGTRGDRYRLSVALGGDAASRARLRAELAARTRPGAGPA